MCIRTVTLGPSVGMDGRGGWKAVQVWGSWSHGEVSGLGGGGGGGRGTAGTEEEPAQTETRQHICFGAESPSGLVPLPTLANLVTSSPLILKAGQALWVFPQGLPEEVGACWLSGCPGSSPSPWLAWAAILRILWAGRVLRQSLTPSHPHAGPSTLPAHRMWRMVDLSQIIGQPDLGFVKIVLV